MTKLTGMISILIFIMKKILKLNQQFKVNRRRSRGDNCVEHSVCIIGRNIQVPCVGLKGCSVFKDANNNSDNNQNTIIIKSNSSGKKLGFSCDDKHKDDTTKALEYLGQWILNVAVSENEVQKEKLLIKLSSALNIFNANISQSVFKESSQSISISTSQIQRPPSLFLIKTALRLRRVNFDKIFDRSNNFKLETSKLTGEALGLTLWKSRDKIHEKKEELENPSFLENYRYEFPLFLSEFFDGLIIALERKKHEVVNKKRRQ
ncbi:unnamed protein product [Rhizophagus irregularis]|nr:unnamed protein product [Rhizophagus irregularis]